MSAESNPRRAARLIARDRHDRVLLFRFQRPDGSTFWATPGGGLEPGESFAEAAIREAGEELGIELSEVGEPLWIDSARFTMATLGPKPILQEETFFTIELDGWTNDVEGIEEFHREEGILESRYWTLEELRLTDETIFPEGFAEKWARVKPD